MKEKLPYDDILKQRLSEYESEVSGDMFERIMYTRGISEPSVDEVVKQKLTDHASNVPSDLFDRIMIERAFKEPSSEDIIKHKLVDHPSAVPSDMFERIMSTREGRRPVVAWWQTGRFRLAMAALIIALILIGYKISENDGLNAPNSEDSKNIVSNSKNTEGVTNTSEKINEGVVSANGARQEGATSTNNLNTKSDNINQKNIDGKNETHEILTPRKGVNKGNATSLANKTDILASNSTKITSNLPQPTFNPSISSTSPSQTDDNSKQLSSETEMPISRNSELFNPLYISFPKGIALSSPSHEDVVKVLPCLGPDGCPTFGSRGGVRPTWYVDVYGAPEYAFRSLKANSLEYTDYRNSRDTIESSQYAFSAGVRATAVFGNGFLLRGGIVYAQTNEKFQKDSFGIGNIRYIIDKNPNTGQLDTARIEITNGIFRKTRYNHYRSLDFTIQGGYEFGLTENVTIGLNAGVNFNIKTARKATILGQDLQPLVISKDNTIYQTSVGTSLVGSVAAYYRLTYRWQLMIEPQFRYYLKRITKSDYGLRQSYSNAGLNIGLRYRL